MFVCVDFSSWLLETSCVLFSGGFYHSGGMLPSWRRFYCCCNKVRNEIKKCFTLVYLQRKFTPCYLVPPPSSSPPSPATYLCVWLFGMYHLWCLSLVQSGSGCGVGAAAGAAGPSRESQCLLGAPRSGHHCPLLGHEHTQGFCRWLRRQGVLSPCRILQTGQGSDCWLTVEIVWFPQQQCI